MQVLLKPSSVLVLTLRYFRLTTVSAGRSFVAVLITDVLAICGILKGVAIAVTADDAVFRTAIYSSSFIAFARAVTADNGGAAVLRTVK